MELKDHPTHSFSPLPLLSKNPLHGVERAYHDVLVKGPVMNNVNPLHGVERNHKQPGQHRTEHASESITWS
jgi:hypothetical protein